jgi:integrase
MAAQADDSEGLSQKFIKELAPPKKGAVTFWDNDPKLSGFGIRVYASGSRSFFVNYRFDGREKRHTIGPWPRWSVTAARERAKELRVQIDRGHDPAGAKRDRRSAPTIQDLIDRCIGSHLPQKTITGPRLDDEKRMLEEIGRLLGKHTKVADVHGGDIADMHRKITESERPVRANRILAIASKLFSLSLFPLAGEDRPWRDAAQGNPCKGVKRNSEDARERFFSQAELAAIGDALTQYPGVASDCVRLIMLTGCRPAEALTAKWEEFDRETGYWIKPSAHTKQRKTHKLPLSPAAIELIGRLRKKRTGKWVFPGDKPDSHLAALWHVWHFVRDRAKLAPDEQGNPARVYDLRHSFASVGAGGGLSLLIIGKLLVF